VGGPALQGGLALVKPPNTELIRYLRDYLSLDRYQTSLASMARTVETVLASNARVDALHQLPYDILRILFFCMDGQDIISVLTTCKTLHLLFNDDAIWQEVCARYNFTDRAIFSGASYFEIYSQVLYCYGFLLGLWASDHPYKGSIIEFRFDKNTSSIVGEVWRFRARHPITDAADSWHSPKMPEYFTFVSISLPPTEGPRRVVLNWHIHHNGAEYFGPGTDFISVPTFHVLSETNESLHLHYQARTCHLPDFPASAHEPWYDSSRGPPRFKVDPAPASTKPNMNLIPSAAFLYMSPTSVTKPQALAIYPTKIRIAEIFVFHETRLPIQDMRQFDLSGNQLQSGSMFYRRFYPLRFPILEGDDPTDEKWRPSSLEGIWLGAYASHGTEVLYVYYNEDDKTVRALKITGDFNVPRGVVTWKFSVDERVQPRDLPHEAGQATRLFGPLSQARVYRGIGTISGPAYVYVLMYVLCIRPRLIYLCVQRGASWGVPGLCGHH
jgi:hypothetical protein